LKKIIVIIFYLTWSLQLFGQHELVGAWIGTNLMHETEYVFSKDSIYYGITYFRGQEQENKVEKRFSYKLNNLNQIELRENQIPFDTLFINESSNEELSLFHEKSNTTLNFVRQLNRLESLDLKLFFQNKRFSLLRFSENNLLNEKTMIAEGYDTIRSSLECIFGMSDVVTIEERQFGKLMTMFLLEDFGSEELNFLPASINENKLKAIDIKTGLEIEFEKLGLRYNLEEVKNQFVGTWVEYKSQDKLDKDIASDVEKIYIGHNEYRLSINQTYETNSQSRGRSGNWDVDMFFNELTLKLSYLEDPLVFENHTLSGAVDLFRVYKVIEISKEQMKLEELRCDKNTESSILIFRKIK